MAAPKRVKKVLETPFLAVALPSSARISAASIDVGRAGLMANVLASVAAYETGIRSERQMAGIAAVKANGCSSVGR